MENSRLCRGDRLAEGVACKVDMCGCETIHVSVGMLTLRLKRDAFEALCETLIEALNRLSARRVQPDQTLC